MTIRIEITAETPDIYRACLDALCRGVLPEATTERVVGMSPALGAPYGGYKPGPWERIETADDGTVSVVEHVDLSDPSAPVHAIQLDPAPHPDEGGPATPVEPTPKKRRTKAEMEAARAAEVPAPLAAQTVTRAISETPEERVEQAEEQPAEPAKALSHDDVRAVLKVVVNAKGMPFATEQLAKIGFGKVSDVPQDKIADVIATLEQAVAA